MWCTKSYKICYYVYIMTNSSFLQKSLAELCTAEHYLFSISDLQSLFPTIKKNNLKVLLSRCAKKGVIRRVCKGIYLYNQAEYLRGLELFHAAARLRAGHFNYISLETALSDEGIISQMPIDTITVMSTGRKSIIDCGEFGKIEFIHTQKKLAALESRIYYDERCRMWRADKNLALEDLKTVGRNLDLINTGVQYDSL